MDGALVRPAGRALRLLVELACLGLAATCCLAAVAAQGGRWNHRLDLITHFAPVWLAGGLASVLLAFLTTGWRRPAVVGCALIAVTASTALMSWDLTHLGSAYVPRPQIRTFKLIEFNAWGGNADLEKVVQWLVQESPDVAIFPEYTEDLAREIESQTGLHAFEGSGALIATRQQPLARYVAWNVRDLPGAPTALTWVVLRGVDGAPFSVFGVHCGWPIPSRNAWGDDRKITAVLDTQDRSRTILAGDFNSTQWSFRQRTADAAFGLERRDRLTFTWPARLPMMLKGAWFPLPFLSIDHVYAGSSWRTVSVQRGPRLGSDHYPLVAMLAWSPPDRVGARDVAQR